MNLESLAKEATQRAKGDAAMVEVPKVEGVMRERRNRHRAKQAIAGTVVVVVFAVVVAAASNAEGFRHPPWPAGEFAQILLGQISYVAQF